MLNLAVSPLFAADGLLYAGTDASGLFVSADGGQSWNRVEADPLSEDSRPAWREQGGKRSINAVVLSPAFPTEPDILVAAQEGLFIAREHGRTWAVRSPISGCVDPGGPLRIG